MVWNNLIDHDRRENDIVDLRKKSCDWWKKEKKENQGNFINKCLYL